MAERVDCFVALLLAMTKSDSQLFFAKIHSMIYQLNKDDFYFPNPRDADEDGLLAFGGDLNPQRLLNAYQNGIFPWPHKNYPLLWFSPATRAVIYPKDLRLTRSFRRSLKRYEIRFDTDFNRIITLCGTVRADKKGTWITPEMIKAYSELFHMGYAHSVESYDENGTFSGGLYGVCIGGMFCGESMVSLQKDASKAALYALCEKVREKNGLIDAQVINPHLHSLGATEISREKFLRILGDLRDKEAIF